MSIELSKMIDKIVTTSIFKLKIKDVDKFANKMYKLYYFFCKKKIYFQVIQKDYPNKNQIPTLNNKVEDCVFNNIKIFALKNRLKN